MAAIIVEETLTRSTEITVTDEQMAVLRGEWTTAKEELLSALLRDSYVALHNEPLEIVNKIVWDADDEDALDPIADYDY